MKYNNEKIYIGNIVKRDYSGIDEIIKKEYLVYMEDEDMFMMVDDYLNYM